MTRTLPLTARPSWEALQAHHRKIHEVHLRTLFADDPKRGERMTAEAAGIFLDYSKNRLTDETLALLRGLAEEAGLRERVEAMFRGDKINTTENRAVLHTALRAPRGTSVTVDGKNVVPEVHAVLDAMSDFADRVRSGAWKGHTRKRIRNVINIGIGGPHGLQRSRHDVPVRLERRWTRSGGGDPRPRSGRDAVYRLLEDLHYPGDDDQRRERAEVAPRRPRRRSQGGQQAFRRRLHQREEGFGVRHRHRQHVRLLGLGGRPVFDSRPTCSS